ncbi:MAG: hypothetical protein SRB1_02020 [Desulfobacteraceae bacterium Eth-SRB1]|nr:MAG: hypothetical protein SRB1_02020 [Desulfobacteraceae bacterium Eth-SRB1]
MSNIWIILSVSILLLFLSNVRKGFYYIIPFMILIIPASRFLYALTENADRNVLTGTITIINFIYFAYSLQLIYQNRSKLLAIDKAILAYILWSLFMMIVGFYSGRISVAFVAFLNTVLPMYFYFIPRFMKLDYKKMFSLILVCFSLLLLWETYQSAYGFFDWEYAYSAMRGEIVTSMLRKNPSGYEASFPAAMLFSVLIVLFFLKDNNTVKHKNIYIIIICLFFFVVLERTPFAAMITAPLVVIILWGSRKSKLGIRFLSAILIILIPLIFINVVIPKLDTLDKRQKRLSELANIQNAPNWEARINRWDRATKYLFSPQVITGYGLGFYAGDTSYSCHRGLHNELYNQLIEYGVIGVIILFLIYYRAILFINERNKSYLLPYFAGLLAFWIIAIVNSPFLNNTKYYHWLFIGMIVSISLSNRKNEYQLQKNG